MAACPGCSRKLNLRGQTCVYCGFTYPGIFEKVIDIVPLYSQCPVCPVCGESIPFSIFQLKHFTEYLCPRCFVWAAKIMWFHDFTNSRGESWKFLTEGKVIVKRPDKQFFLDIKEGKWSYEKIIKFLEDMDEELAEIYQNKTYVVPHRPDMAKLSKLCQDIVIEAVLLWG